MKLDQVISLDLWHATYTRGCTFPNTWNCLWRRWSTCSSSLLLSLSCKFHLCYTHCEFLMFCRKRSSPWDSASMRTLWVTTPHSSSRRSCGSLWSCWLQVGHSSVFISVLHVVLFLSCVKPLAFDTMSLDKHFYHFCHSFMVLWGP